MTEDDTTGDRAERLRYLTEMIAYPVETPEREYKSWLDLSLDEHKAVVAKSLIAHANTGGGFLIFGFTEGNDGLLASAKRPPDLSAYTHDAINGIGAVR